MVTPSALSGFMFDDEFKFAALPPRESRAEAIFASHYYALLLDRLSRHSRRDHGVLCFTAAMLRASPPCQ